jgi:very-short-patch-repair endonuclease
MLPSEAAKWVDRNRPSNEWIPEPVTPGGTLPLSPDDVAELYQTNASLSREEGAELEQGAPALDEVPAVDAFRALIDALEASETPELRAFWDRPASAREAQHLARLEESVSDAAGDLAIMERWQRVLLAAGYDAGSEAELWRELAAMARQCLTRLEKVRPYLVQYDPQLPPGLPPDVVIQLSRELEAHVEKGGALGMFSLTLNSSWRRFLREAKCNGRSPRTADELRGLRLLAELRSARAALALRWKRQAEPAGLPPFDSFGEEPEPSLASYTQQFDRLLAWWAHHQSHIAGALQAAGFRWQLFRDREIARSQPSTPFERDLSILSGALLEAVYARGGLVNRARALEVLEQLELALQQFEGPRTRALADAVSARSGDSYDAAYEALSALLGRTETLARRKTLLDALEPDAGGWARAIRDRLPGHDAAAPPGDPVTAWTWHQLDRELARRAALDEVRLTRQLHQRSEELRDVTARLIDRRAWLEQIRRIDLGARQALQGWAQIQRRIGRGTGKRVPSLLSDARRLLAEASDAVPVWIMPLARVAESFDPRKGRFDVVIIDEASQSDVTGLLAWYFGEQVVVVGDHEQVSPLAVGRKVEAVDQLIGRHLAAIPNATLYDGQLSVYDLAKMSFGGTIALREHFRCVPQIIDFSNYLCYNGEIRPLRDPLRVPRPHVIEHVVAGSSRDGLTNRREAQELVAILKALIELPQNRRRSMGAISLLGEEQAWLIQQLALEAIGAVELERHRFTAGNAAQFQGDERHIMLLSMVDVSTGAALPLRETDLYRQRFNVAASRAKDQLWLLHSLNPHRDLQPGDLRRRLIEHVRSPGDRRLTTQHEQERAESELERSVLERLLDAGYRVEPQVWVGHYRIDMVVSDDKAQVALECDGDRFHAADRIAEDMARQAVLERAGWRFIRVRGTRYYRDPEGTMRWVVDELARLGIEPSSAAAPASTLADKAFQETIVRRAWAIMGELGWLEE